MNTRTTQAVRTLRVARPESIDLTQRRRWYEDSGAGADDAPPPDPDPTPAKGGQDDGGKTFTQADLDQMISDRLKRDREAQRKQWLETLGYENEDALKADVEAKRKADEADQTELEKAQAKIEAAEQKAVEAETRATAAEQAALEERRNTAILNALKDAEYPADVLLWLTQNRAEAVTATIAEDGTVDTKAVEKLVADVKKERPTYFKTGGPGSPSNAGGRVPQPDSKTKDEIRKGIRVRY